MCAIISTADLQYETFERLEEESLDRLVTRRLATQLEYGWELDAREIPEFDAE